jgi:hypothetical protein
MKTASTMSAVAVLLLVLLTFEEAPTRCGFRSAFVAPYPTAMVPRNPRLFLFAPFSKETPKLKIRDSAGRKLEFTLRRTPEGGLPAYELLVNTGDAKAFEIEHKSYDNFKQSFVVVEDWAPAPPIEDSIRVEFSAYMWTCSHELAQLVYLPSQAPAYEVHWTRSDSTGVQRQSIVVPASTKWYFRDVSMGPSVLTLGYANCLGSTFTWAVDTVVLTVVALWPDGSDEVVANNITVPRPATPDVWPEPSWFR